MGSPVSQEIRRLLEERKLLRIKPDNKLVTKEIKGAEYDLKRAIESLEKEDFKWATVQAYYSMFHSARALLYKEGYREKSHTALRIALKELFVNSGKISGEAYRDFEDAMDLRQEADYGLEYSVPSSTDTVNEARKFLEMVKNILNR
jgi:uncharacterized protein (UPF0332 family)